MRNRTRLMTVALAAGISTLAVLRTAADSSTEFEPSEIEQILSMRGSLLSIDDATNAALGKGPAIALGRALFFDPRLSRSGTVSCASCHDPQKSWSDGLPSGVGLGKGARNTPSLWNVGGNRWFSWDGKASTLWAQTLLPIEDPIEMGGGRANVASLVASEPTLASLYKAAFGTGINQETDVNMSFARVGKALAAYVATITSTNSRFDVFAESLERGDILTAHALSTQEKHGLKLFLGKARCVTCHHGPNFTDGEFHNLRLPDRGMRFPSDAGRYVGIEKVQRSEFGATSRYSDDSTARAAKMVKALERRPEQWGSFKTPSLRNVAKTAPYMHGGQFATLREVVRYYSTFEGAATADHHQVMTLVQANLDDAEIDALVAFLQALTDEPRLRQTSGSTKLERR